MNEKNISDNKSKIIFKEGILPFLIQMLILVFVILEFYFLISNKSSIYISEKTNDNDPNLYRFIYMLISLFSTFILLFWSKKTKTVKKQFWISLISGILFWQAIGECSWHFKAPGIDEFFPRIEGANGTFILIMIIPLLIYLFKTKDFPWYLKIFIFSFMLNWCGHFIMAGIDELTMLPNWIKISGYFIGLPGLVYTIYLLFKSNTLEERLILSMFLYTFFSIVVEGIFGMAGKIG